MDIKAIADDLAALCRQGKDMEAVEKYYADDIVSEEPMGEHRRFEGLDQVKKKHDWWTNTFEVHGVEVEGPWLNEPQFILKFTIDTTERESGNRSKQSEYALYTVTNGKISHERFFYGPE